MATLNKYIVYLGIAGCESIIDVSDFEDSYIEWQLLSDKTVPTKKLEKVVSTINSMELRSRFNSHREIEPYVWSTDLNMEELWNALESENHQKMIIKFAKPYLNTQGKL